MAVPLLVAGLVLLIAGAGWFTGAATVGLILTILGVVGILLQVLIVGAFARIASKSTRDIRRNF